MVFLPNLGVNRRDRLCGIQEYASAHSLDFLDLGQKSSFLNWKRRQVSIFKKIINGWALSKYKHLLKIEPIGISYAEGKGNITGFISTL